MPLNSETLDSESGNKNSSPNLANDRLHDMNIKNARCVSVLGGARQPRDLRNI